MKKIFILGIIFISCLFINITSNAAGTILPPGAVGYQSKEDIPAASNASMGNFSLIQDFTLYKETPKTENTVYYYRLYLCQTAFSLPYENISEVYEFQQSGSIELTFTQQNLETYTYENILSNTLSTSIGTSVKNVVGIPIAQVSASLETSLTTSITQTISMSHSISLASGQSITLNYNIAEPGYYQIQRRATYSYYIVQRIGYIYNMKMTKNGYIRTTLNCYALLDSTGIFVYKGAEALGLYKYLRDSSGYGFILDQNYINSSSNVRYL